MTSLCSNAGTEIVTVFVRSEREDQEVLRGETGSGASGSLNLLPCSVNGGVDCRSAEGRRGDAAAVSSGSPTQAHRPAHS